MKNLKYILIGCLLIIISTSCKKWLDVNTDPDNPNNQSVLIQNRLPWIEHFYMYSAGVANYRTACQAGVYYSMSGTQNTFTIKHGLYQYLPIYLICIMSLRNKALIIIWLQLMYSMH